MSIVAEALAPLQNRRVSATLLAPSTSAGVTLESPDQAWPLARLERWFLRGCVFLLPLAFSWETYDGYALPKLLLARVLITGLLVLWLARIALTGTLVIRRTALDLPVLAFVLSAAVSALFAYNLNTALFGTYSRYDGLFTLASYAALFWLAVQTLATKEHARGLLRTLLASGYAVSVIAILQSITDSLRLGELAPAFGTMGQKNSLGALLAMLLPLACWELVAARSWVARLLAFNAVAILGLALVLTFSRSAWLATAIALMLMLVATRRGWLQRLMAAGAVAVVLGAAAAAVLQAPGVPLQRTDLAALGDRPVVWADTLHLIASRPVLGYGPDNFGLVYGRFESTDLHQPWDKAHSELLQIGATQGAAGVATYVWLIAAFAVAFWRGPHDPAAYAVLAAWLAYQLTLQINFTTLAAALPFWAFMAAAVVLLGATWERAPTATRRGPPLTAATSLAAAAVIAVGGASIAYPYLADRQLLAAVIADYAGSSAAAVAPAQEARLLGPWESVYATEVGNLAFESQHWALAREAYREAARLGTYNPGVYRNLALADINLGLTLEAREAARQAVALDRFDPANVALLAQFDEVP